MGFAIFYKLIWRTMLKWTFISRTYIKISNDIICDKNIEKILRLIQNWKEA